MKFYDSCFLTALILLAFLKSSILSTLSLLAGALQTSAEAGQLAFDPDRCCSGFGRLPAPVAH